MNIHLIAIGGAIMHNLAIALNDSGHQVSGSDDEIFEPSKSRLAAKGLLPETSGWDLNRINKELDAVIVGMHAKEDNPELIKAKELDLEIFSFPEFTYLNSKDKQRVAICGSHGKTTITSMVMHGLSKNKQAFDYLVGAQLKGFDCMVQFSDAPVIVIEGDEYFTSAMDKRPKFFHYKPQIALITGIAWDHFNVFPTYQSYTDQFKKLIESMSAESFLIVNKEDDALKDLVSETESKASVIYYKPLPYQYADSGTVINLDDSSYTVKVFGRHNISNMCGALEVCKCLGLSEHDFLASMSDFEGASKRLERIDSSEIETVYRDFAHAPSKVKASVEAVAEMHPDKTINAILELHTFSSLNKDFLPQYSGTMDAIDNSVVFFNPETLKHKGLPPLDKEFIIESFKHQNLKVIDNTEELNQYLRSNKTDVLLLMSSGNFGNLVFEGLI